MEFKEKLLKYKPYTIVAIIILGLITFNIYTLTLVQNNDSENEEITLVKTKEKAPKTIKIDIKGQINAPGVYELDNSARVIDLIDKAGGLTKTADTSIINLSKKLEDEMVVFIYSKTEVNRLKEENKNKTITNACPKTNDACPEKELETITENENTTKSSKQTSTDKISINTATLEELQTLSGIGESKAKAIIAYRNEKGKFKTTEDIKNVSGIGDAAYEKIKDKITT